MLLKIKNIVPNTRIAVFKGSGNRDYTDDDIMFHDECIFEKELELNKGDYFIRTIHKEFFFENIDVDLNEEDQVITLKNRIDPSSVDNLENHRFFISEYLEKSNNDQSDLIGLYKSLRKKYKV